MSTSTLYYSIIVSTLPQLPYVIWRSVFASSKRKHNLSMQVVFVAIDVAVFSVFFLPTGLPPPTLVTPHAYERSRPRRAGGSGNYCEIYSDSGSHCRQYVHCAYTNIIYI